jgi:protocatechuate 3,4-dioxygenase beta subunit
MTSSPRRSPKEIAGEVVASFVACPDDRVRELMQSLVTHLHAFAREVRLTPEEWAHAMAVLAETGRVTDDNRHEFILWSDTLGLSMAVDALADDRDPRATESTVEGPFWAPGAPDRAFGESIARRSGGVPLWMHGRVLETNGNPIANAEIDVWQNGPDRLYAVQDQSAPQDHLRGKFHTEDDGAYAVSDSRRRTGRRNAPSNRATIVATRARPRGRLGTRIPNAGHTHFRQQLRLPRDRRRLCRQTFTDQDIRAARCNRPNSAASDQRAVVVNRGRLRARRRSSVERSFTMNIKSRSGVPIGIPVCLRLPLLAAVRRNAETVFLQHISLISSSLPRSLPDF